MSRGAVFLEGVAVVGAVVSGVCGVVFGCSPELDASLWHLTVASKSRSWLGIRSLVFGAG